MKMSLLSAKEVVVKLLMQRTKEDGWDIINRSKHSSTKAITVE